MKVHLWSCGPHIGAHLNDMRFSGTGLLPAESYVQGYLSTSGDNGASASSAMLLPDCLPASFRTHASGALSRLMCRFL